MPSQRGELPYNAGDTKFHEAKQDMVERGRKLDRVLQDTGLESARKSSREIRDASIDTYVRPECLRRRPESRERLAPLGNTGVLAGNAPNKQASDPWVETGTEQEEPHTPSRPKSRRLMTQSSQLMHDGATENGQDGAPAGPVRRTPSLTPSRRRPSASAAESPAAPSRLNTTGNSGCIQMAGDLCAGAIEAAFDHACGSSVEHEASEIRDLGDDTGELCDMQAPGSPSIMSVYHPLSPDHEDKDSSRAESPSLVVLEEDVQKALGKDFPRPCTPPQTARSQRPVRVGAPQPLSARARCAAPEGFSKKAADSGKSKSGRPTRTTARGGA